MIRNLPSRARGLQQCAPVFAALLVAACTPDAPAPSASSKPVVVYADAAFESTLGTFFARYREETGAILILRYGAPDEIVDDVIRNDISPPADILLTSTVTRAWRAAEEGALRPIYSDVVDASIPAWARDPEGLWLGLRFEPAGIVSPDASPALHYVALADAEFAGKLCLSSAAIPVNRAVVAMLIESMGTRDAELVVRGWIKNLSQPPYDREASLVDALKDGRCQAGIVSASAGKAGGLDFSLPTPTYGDVDAIGIARHARNPDDALHLIEWLIGAAAVGQWAESQFAGNKNVGLAAWYAEDAARLAERAGYR